MQREIDMNYGRSLLKVFSTIGLILTLGMSMSACGGSENWKEEVQLSDGRIVVVERQLIREAGGDEWASNRSGSKPKEYRIRFVDSDGLGKTIEWRSTKIDSQTWPEVPLVFDIASGKPIVFSLFSISNGCEVYSKYVYQNGAWTEEPLPEQFAQRPANLLFGSHKDMPTLVNQEEKRVRNNYVGVRRALEQIGPNRKVCG
jgi:hypothetical protein